MNGWTTGNMDGWIGGWTNTQFDGWMNGWMDSWKCDWQIKDWMVEWQGVTDGGCVWVVPTLALSQILQCRKPGTEKNGLNLSQVPEARHLHSLRTIPYQEHINKYIYIYLQYIWVSVCVKIASKEHIFVYRQIDVYKEKYVKIWIIP